MTDDEILKAAGEIERERDVLADPRWQALAEGSLGEADRAELSALASRSEDGRRALALYRPFDAGEHAALADRILADLPPGRAQVIPLGPRRRKLAAWITIGSLAAAAALFLIFTSRRASDAIPTYEIAMAGEQARRGTPGDVAPRTLGPGSEVDLILRPAVDVKGPLAARCAILRDGRAEAWAPPIEISADGAVRIAGARDAVFRGVAPGAIELVIAVGRPGSIPSDAAMVEGALRGPPSGPRDGSWRLLRVPVRLVDRGSPAGR